MRVTTQQLREPRVQLLAEGRRQRETPSWGRAGRLIYRGNLRGVAAINVHNRLGARFVDRRKTCELVCRFLEFQRMINALGTSDVLMLVEWVVVPAA